MRTLNKNLLSHSDANANSYYTKLNIRRPDFPGGVLPPGTSLGWLGIPHHLRILLNFLPCQFILTAPIGRTTPRPKRTMSPPGIVPENIVNGRRFNLPKDIVRVNHLLPFQLSYQDRRFRPRGFRHRGLLG